MLPKIKDYLIDNFEGVFVLVILVSVALINYYVPYKVAFLDFYYLPVLLSAYYLGLNKTLYGTIFCIFLVVIFAYISPETFELGNTKFDLFFNIAAWASFLILTGIIVSKIQEKFSYEQQLTSELNKDLTQKEEKLAAANKELEEYATNLEKKVKERTEDLENSKRLLEDLKTKVEDTLYTTMDPVVARMVIENRLQNEKREISVLFSDLEGFTGYSEERRSEVVIEELNAYLEEMESILIAYGGHIDKYMGDGIMVEFGAPISHETHALMAVVAGLKMQERLQERNFPWRMRIGIASGDAIMGIIGSKRQTYSAIGDVVNMASRIQEYCRPDFVTIDRNTYENTKRSIHVKSKLRIIDDTLDENTMQHIQELLEILETDTDNLEANKELGFIYQKIKDLPQAIEYFKRVLELAPDDDQTKLAYAEVSLEIGRLENIPIRGKTKSTHLYEVIGLQDPLKDREAIPQKLFDRYSEIIEKAVEYPEAIILPVEVLFGSVGYARTVGFLSYALADSMELLAQEKEDILLAGYLANIGMAIIPHHLLNRPGNLTNQEFEEIEKHPSESVRTLKNMGYQTPHIFEIIEAHHEKIDGTGYPKHLNKNDIPLGATIVAIAERYTALTSRRPYRDRWDYRVAYSEIQKIVRSGQLDHRVVDALGRLLDLV